MKGFERPTTRFILSLKREQLWNIWLQGVEISEKTVLTGVASISWLNQEVKMCPQDRSEVSAVLPAAFLSGATWWQENGQRAGVMLFAGTHPKGNPVRLPPLSSKSQGSFTWPDRYQQLRSLILLRSLLSRMRVFLLWLIMHIPGVNLIVLSQLTARTNQCAGS